MFLRMNIQHEIINGTFQTRAQSLVEGKSGASYFGSTFEIKNAQPFTNVPVCFRLKTEFCRLAPFAYYRIITVILANRHIICRHVWNGQKNIFEFLFYFFKLFVVLGNFFTKGTHSKNFIIGIFAAFLHFAYFLRDAVTLAL
ncbi:hypothetical protein SDC9_161074 [bioreactor metagenome]|uniref:Uncharacterized protein n=1 Tax=bioreactor metagenome TaxID=1076179 RepID=A0A645FK84_9ZZZZ